MVNLTLTINEAARQLGDCRRTIYNQMDRGELPFTKTPAGRRIDAAAVQAILDARQRVADEQRAVEQAKDVEERAELEREAAVEAARLARLEVERRAAAERAFMRDWSIRLADFNDTRYGVAERPRCMHASNTQHAYKGF
jgi:excisionase family DNA binding protein